MTALKYLFTAIYGDGTYLLQNEEDVSAHDSTKSAFYDVRQPEVISFELRGEGHTYIVDLTDGHFEVDGRPIWVGEPPQQGAPLRLIFFRRHKQDLVLGSNERFHSIRYFIGWQTTVEGRNQKALMGID